MFYTHVELSIPPFNKLITDAFQESVFRCFDDSAKDEQHQYLR